MPQRTFSCVRVKVCGGIRKKKGTRPSGFFPDTKTYSGVRQSKKGALKSAEGDLNPATQRTKMKRKFKVGHTKTGVVEQMRALPVGKSDSMQSGKISKREGTE